MTKKHSLSTVRDHLHRKVASSEGESEGVLEEPLARHSLPGGQSLEGATPVQVWLSGMRVLRKYWGSPSSRSFGGSRIPRKQLEEDRARSGAMWPQCVSGTLPRPPETNPSLPCSSSKKTAMRVPHICVTLFQKSGLSS